MNAAKDFRIAGPEWAREYVETLLQRLKLSKAFSPEEKASFLKFAGGWFDDEFEGGGGVFILHPGEKGGSFIKCIYDSIH